LANKLRISNPSGVRFPQDRLEVVNAPGIES
jgi:hypothetical protein